MRMSEIVDPLAPIIRPQSAAPFIRTPPPPYSTTATIHRGQRRLIVPSEQEPMEEVDLDSSGEMGEAETSL
jgi:hypothetical protein